MSEQGSCSSTAAGGRLKCPAARIRRPSCRCAPCDLSAQQFSETSTIARNYVAEQSFVALFPASSILLWAYDFFDKSQYIRYFFNKWSGKLSVPYLLEETLRRLTVRHPITGNKIKMVITRSVSTYLLYRYLSKYDRIVCSKYTYA